MNANEIARSPKLRRLVHDSNRTFEVRTSPWMARCRDGLMLRCHGWQGAAGSFVDEANAHNLWAF